MSPSQPQDGALAPVLGTLLSRREWLKSAMVAAAALATAAALPSAHAKGSAKTDKAKGEGKDEAEISAPAAVATAFAATMSVHGVPGGPFPLRGWREEFPAAGSALELFAVDSLPLKVLKDLDQASAALSAMAHSGAVAKKARLTIYRSGLPWLRADFADVTIVATTLAVQASSSPEHTVTLRYQDAQWRELAQNKGQGAGKGAKVDDDNDEHEDDDSPSLESVA